MSVVPPALLLRPAAREFANGTKDAGALTPPWLLHRGPQFLHDLVNVAEAVDLHHPRAGVGGAGDAAHVVGQLPARRGGKRNVEANRLRFAPATGAMSIVREEECVLPDHVQPLV